MSAPSSPLPATDGAAADTSCSAVSESPPAASPAAQPVPARRGGVGAGLATAAWWDAYYRQMHSPTWDWYLPNELVFEEIEREARALLPAVTAEEEASDSNAAAADGVSSLSLDSTVQAASPPLPSSSSSCCSFASLSVLQLGCGNSDLSGLLFDAGFRRVSNVDFSPECIARMRLMATERGWDDAASDSKCAAVEGSQGEVDRGFVFRVMDVRALSYPAACFDLALDKGTLDCVSLESDDGERAARDMCAETWRVLRRGGVSVCFSLYPPSKRAAFWIDTPVEGERERDEELAAWREDLRDVMQCDNPPSRIVAPAWELSWRAIDCSPLELPNQPHTFLYVCTKR